MVFLADTGSVYEVPVDRVWQYLSSGLPHETAHGHRRVERVTLSDTSGEYSWEQVRDGIRGRVTMRWTAFFPLGLAYEVLQGPLAGSKFFQYYIPRGEHTEVSVVGEFTSPSLSNEAVEAEARQFFETEYLEDAAAILTWRPRR